MSSTFQPTGSGGTGLPYSNVSRIQLEQIRKADFFAGSKALTVGDSGNNADTSPNNALGPGDINAEQFFTQQSTLLDDVYSLTPNPQPGTDLPYVSQVANVSSSPTDSETVTWYGPVRRQPVATLSANSTTQITDVNGDFTHRGIVAGDLIIFGVGAIGGTGAANTYCVAAVQTVNSDTQITVTGIANTFNGNGTAFVVDGDTYPYLLVHPTAIRLFAYPGSGPTTGEEQTFLTVTPSTTLHSQSAPSTGQINAKRITNIVPPNYNLNNPNPINPSVDAADSVYGIYAPRTDASLLGYRWMVYPDNGSQAPNLAAPITPASVIDPTAALTGDQRTTFDYKAGIFRLSCAPKLGGAFKVAGGVDPTSGRLNLWAVFWAIPQTVGVSSPVTTTKGAARALYSLRSNATGVLTPGTGYFDTADNVWRFGSTTQGNGNDFVAMGVAHSEDEAGTVRFGYMTPNAGAYGFAGFVYHSAVPGKKFINAQVNDAFALDYSGPVGADPVSTVEIPIDDKKALTFSDITAIPYNPALDYPPIQTFSAAQNGPGARDSLQQLSQAVQDIFTDNTAAPGLRRLHLRAGRYYSQTPFVIPPGFSVEGDYGSTMVQSRAFNGNPMQPMFKFGPNTTTGVYDVGATTNSQSTSDGLYPAPIGNIGSTGSFNPSMEGMSTVWNPVRRVWAVAFADAANNSITFAEFNETGTTVKRFVLDNSTTPSTGTLFTSSNSAGLAGLHTPGHYPRLAYHEHSDTYGMVWVNEVNLSGTVGPQVSLIFFNFIDPTTNAAAPLLSTPQYPFGTTPITFSGGTYTDHPSIAVDNGSTSANCSFWVSYWSYNIGGFGWAGAYVGSNTSNFLVATVAGGGIVGTFTYNTNTVSSETTSPLLFLAATNQAVITCTDVVADNEGGYMTVFAQRDHQTIFSSTGTAIASILQESTGTLHDSGSNNYETYGMTTSICSKVCFLGPNTWNGAGYDAIVQNITGGGTTLTVGGVEDHDWAALSGTVQYAIVAPSRVFASRSGATPYPISDGNPVGNVGNLWSNDTYEMDYLRLARGGTNGSVGWLLVYQAMNTTAFASRATIKAFDDGYNTTLIYNQTYWPGGQLASLLPAGGTDLFREHISTCSVVLSDNAQISYPFPPRGVDTYTALAGTGGDPAGNFPSQQSRDLEVSLRSLGGRPPVGSRPNFYTDTNYNQPQVLATFSLGSENVTGGSNLLTTVLPGWWVKDLNDPARDYCQVLSVNSNSNMTLRTPYLGTGASGIALVSTSPNPYTRRGRSLDKYISFLNFALRWPTNHVPSFFPDVSWTGEDWVIVSPIVDTIHSKTGTVFNSNTNVQYLVDPLFYFGSDAANTTDGNFLAKTVADSTTRFPDFIYFPGYGVGSLFTVVDEHTIQLASNLTGISTSTYVKGVEWYLVKADYFGNVLDAGFKYPGFRVAPDGRVLVSSSFITQADPAIDQEIPQPWSSTGPIQNKVQTMSWSNMATGESTVSGSPGDGHLSPGSDPQDPPDPESRIIADLRYNGVVVGAPKSIALDYQTNGNIEQPMVALAWGENYYGFFARNRSGGLTGTTFDGTSDAIYFYKQSFGPYNSSLRNMQLTSASSTYNGSQRLKVLSSKHVYTRHPTMGNMNFGGNFATDGFRNCFVTNESAFSKFIPLEIGGTYQYGEGLTTAAYYTNALGDGAIRKQAWQINNEIVTNAGGSVTYGALYGYEITDNYFDANLYPAFAPYVSGPKVIWDGQRFVAVWFETFNAQAFPSTPSNICLGILPGDEDSGPQGLELLDPSDAAYAPTMIETVRVSSGASRYDIIHFDVAYSGNTYAVLYCTGLDPNVGAGGANVGVAIFEGISQTTSQAQANVASSMASARPPPSGHNYGLQSVGIYGFYGWPKIVWDGKQYMGVYTVFAGGVGSDGLLFTQSIPEYGMARGTQIKCIGAAFTTGTGAASDGALGQPTGSASNTGCLFTLNTNNNLLAPIVPGDLLVVTGYLGSPSSNATGVYMITDYNPATQNINVLVTSAASASFQTMGYTFGYIMGGSVGDVTVLPGDTGLSQTRGSLSTTGYNGGESFELGYVANANNTYYPRNAGTSDVFDSIYRINGLIYNEVRDEYAILYTVNTENNPPTGASAILAASFKRGDSRLSPGQPVTNIIQLADNDWTSRVASWAWNGRNYCVITAPYNLSGQFVFDQVNYTILNATFGIEEQGTIANLSPIHFGAGQCLVGNTAGLVPGPLYGAFNQSSLIVPHIRNVQVQWNPRLNRWVVSAQVAWYDDSGSPGGLIGELAPNGTVGLSVFGSQSLTGSGGHYTYTTNANGTGFITVTNNGTHPLQAQPGCKLVFSVGGLQEGTATCLACTTTGSQTFITIDRNSAEMLGTTLSSGVAQINLANREDVFCFTLGYDAPAVQLHDADYVSIENVTFGGTADIEEKYVKMARPMWQAGGIAAGLNAGILSGLQYQYSREAQYNHRLMVPTLKTALARFSNVLSTAKYRNGTGMVPGSPTVDRYSYDGKNRRG